MEVGFGIDVVHAAGMSGTIVVFAIVGDARLGIFAIGSLLTFGIGEGCLIIVTLFAGGVLNLICGDRWH